MTFAILIIAVPYRINNEMSHHTNYTHCIPTYIREQCVADFNKPIILILWTKLYN